MFHTCCFYRWACVIGGFSYVILGQYDISAKQHWGNPIVHILSCIIKSQKEVLEACCMFLTFNALSVSVWNRSGCRLLSHLHVHLQMAGWQAKWHWYRYPTQRVSCKRWAPPSGWEKAGTTNAASALWKVACLVKVSKADRDKTLPLTVCCT